MKAWTATLFLGLALILHGCGISGGDTGGPSTKIDELSIENIEIVSVTDSSATVEWTTTLSAVSTFLYGPNAAILGLTKASPLGKTHQAPLDNLQEDTEYHFRIAADDGNGTVETELASLRTEVSEDHNDTSVPIISGIQVIGVTPSSVTIVWNTDDRTTGWIAWGPGLANDLSTPANEYRRSHALVISGLNSDTEYDFQIHATNRAVLTGHSSPGVFHTEALPTLTIVPGAPEYTVGQEMTFDIRVDNATNVAGLQLMISYAASKIQVTQFRQAEFFNDGGHIWLLRDQDLFPIDADFTWQIRYEDNLPIGSEAPRSGVLATITARAIGRTDATNIFFQLLPVDAAPEDTYDPTNSNNATRLLDHHREPIPVTVRDATVKIS